MIRKQGFIKNEFHIQELEQLYDFYLDKLENGVYKNRKNNQAELIHNEKETVYGTQDRRSVCIID